MVLFRLSSVTSEVKDRIDDLFNFICRLSRSNFVVLGYIHPPSTSVTRYQLS